MNLTLHCDCSRQVVVHIASAGARMRCECGRELKVPALSEFRSQAGLSAIPVNSTQLIAQKLRSGELPGSTCAGCGALHAPTLSLMGHCERSYSQRELRGTAGNTLTVIVAVLMFAIGAIIMPLTMLLRRESEEPDKRLGRDVSVPVPLLLCDACQQIRGRPFPIGSIAIVIATGLILWFSWLILPRPIILISAVIYIVFVAGLAIVGDLEQNQQRQWKSWLKLVPDYAQMLKEFPSAEIELVRTQQASVADTTP